MRALRILRGAAVGVACLGVIMPQARLLAATPADESASTEHTQQVVDVELGAGGTLTGQVVDTQGVGIEGTVVSVRQGDREITRVATDAQGRYQAQNLRGGFYQIVAGQGYGFFRLWAPETAPPAARTDALVVSGDNAVLAQGGLVPVVGGVDLITMLILAGVTTSTVFSILAYEEAKDNNDNNGPVSP